MIKRFHLIKRLGLSHAGRISRGSIKGKRYALGYLLVGRSLLSLLLLLLLDTSSPFLRLGNGVGANLLLLARAAAFGKGLGMSGHE